MRTYQRDVRPSRSLAQILQESAIIVGNDRGEYGFIALVGGCAAGIVTLMLQLSAGSIALVAAAPAVVLIGALTHAASTAAYRRVMDSLDPDGGRALVAAFVGSPAFLRPWLPLAGVLGAGALVGAAGGGYMNGTIGQLYVLALALFAAGYALPRSYHAMALVTHWPNAREAEAVSTSLVWASSARVIAGGIAALGPAIVAGMVALAAGFGTVSSAIAASVFVASTPLAAIVMGQLFLDAVSRAEQVQLASARRASAKDAALRRTAPDATPRAADVLRSR